MIGDPGGKSAERNLLTREQLNYNVGRIKLQLERLLDFHAPSNPARLVDNADWTAPVSFLDFLRDIGKHFSLSSMLAKDSVRSRLESESGLVIQQVQLPASSGQRFPPSQISHSLRTANRRNRTVGQYHCGHGPNPQKAGDCGVGTDVSPHHQVGWHEVRQDRSWSRLARSKEDQPAIRFYQFFVNTEDSMVVGYLKKFTLIERSAIEELEVRHLANPGAREAHKAGA